MVARVRGSDSGSAPRMPVYDMQTRFLPHLRNAANELGTLLR